MIGIQIYIYIYIYIFYTHAVSFSITSHIPARRALVLNGMARRQSYDRLDGVAAHHRLLLEGGS